MNDEPRRMTADTEKDEDESRLSAIAKSVLAMPPEPHKGGKERPQTKKAAKTPRESAKRSKPG